MLLKALSDLFWLWFRRQLAPKVLTQTPQKLSRHWEIFSVPGSQALLLCKICSSCPFAGFLAEPLIRVWCCAVCVASAVQAEHLSLASKHLVSMISVAFSKCCLKLSCLG